MKLLLSAYACEPDIGSEQEVGWRWAMEMARYCEVTVVTRSNSKPLIDGWIAKHPNEQIPRFVYVDLGLWARILKKRVPGGIYVYYGLWQMRLRKVCDKLIKEESYDLGHHITFASYRQPVGLHGLPLIWGPVGGGDMAPWELMRNHGTCAGRLRELFRNLMTRIANRCLFLTRPSKADLRFAMATTPATQEILMRSGIPCILMPTIGCDAADTARDKNVRRQDRIRLLFVGRLHLLKGIHLLLHALAHIPAGSFHLDIVGSGPERGRLLALTKKLSISDSVTFLGHMRREELENVYVSHDVIIAPSLYESGGLSVLEAFAHCLPAIVLDCGGHALSVAEGCGFRIPIHLSQNETVIALAEAIQRYVDQPHLITQHGRNAYTHLRNAYDWDQKRTAMFELYQLAMASEPSHS